ncbi:MAG: hypothetical protein BWZ10_00066 [candidate division BRC1 bacterium ADurb.BinA364]|nr:MAG: hypothetical protein BWZ10_00066 [candidate division BRC1 bacterium ADurb.BinA364]
MINHIGEAIFENRKKAGLTQDRFGIKYSVSGPAIFKFERGYVKPSLELWIKMAKDFDMSERKAVLLWVQAKLPEEYQNLIDFASPKTDEMASKRPKSAGAIRDYSRIAEQEELKRLSAKDTSLPKPLRDLLADDELWAHFRPTGQEINILRDSFGKLGKGTKSAYREALRLIREFTGGF